MGKPGDFHIWRPHPWHGLSHGPAAPSVVCAFIEICPFDLVKYEVDKVTGYLRVDRPQRTSSQPPTLYGFIPRTYCGSRVGSLMAGAVTGDRDPLDICVVSERPITRSEILLSARVIGGLPMLDAGEADDKIVAVLENDPIWSEVDDVAGLPPAFLNRLRHYFETYKLEPGRETTISVGPAYGREQAERVIQAAIADYEAEFGTGS